MLSIAQLNWDDVRVFLAAMRASSVRQVGEDLGISHPTASRRLSLLEERLALRLFDRRPDGLHPTPQAAELAVAAEDVERAMLTLGRVAQAANPELKGPIRLSLSAAVASDLLMPDLVAFSERWPEIELEVTASSGIADLAQREADVAIRICPVGESPDPDLTGRKAATAYRAVYGSGNSWIGWRTGPRALAAQVPPDLPEFGELPVRAIINDLALQRSACAEGLGLARLPCFYAEPLLTPRTAPEPGGDIWVLLHPDLRKSNKLRVFRDAIVAALKRHQPRLEGRSSRSDLPAS